MYENIEIEIIEESGKKIVFLAHDGSSGCKYEFTTKEELKQIVKDYVEDVIDYEYEE